MRCAIIAPANNEEGNAEPLFRRISEAMAKVEAQTDTLIVDDGSTNLTFLRLKELRRAFPSLRVVSLDGNRGQSDGLAWRANSPRLPSSCRAEASSIQNQGDMAGALIKPK